MPPVGVVEGEEKADEPCRLRRSGTSRGACLPMGGLLRARSASESRHHLEWSESCDKEDEASRRNREKVGTPGRGK